MYIYIYRERERDTIMVYCYLLCDSLEPTWDRAICVTIAICVISTGHLVLLLV